MAGYVFEIKGDEDQLEDFCAVLRGFGMEATIKRSAWGQALAVNNVPGEAKAKRIRTRGAGRKAIPVRIDAKHSSMSATDFLGMLESASRDEAMSLLGMKYVSSPTYYRRLEAIEEAAGDLRSRLGREPRIGEVADVVNAGL